MVNDQSEVMLDSSFSRSKAARDQRRRFTLAGWVFLIYGGFVLTMVLSPQTLAQEVVPGVPLCLMAGPAVIAFGIALALWSAYRGAEKTI